MYISLFCGKTSPVTPIFFPFFFFFFDFKNKKSISVPTYCKNLNEKNKWEVFLFVVPERVQVETMKSLFSECSMDVCRMHVLDYLHSTTPENPIYTNCTVHNELSTGDDHEFTLIKLSFAHFFQHPCSY